MMTVGSRAPTIEGFSKISFWREETTGIITLLSPGTFDQRMISEMIKSLSIAAVDDKVKSILITGSNFVFSKGLELPKNSGYADLRSYYDNLRSLVLFILSIEKPIFSAINGSVMNNGVSFALLSDLILISEETKVTIDGKEPMVFLYSLSAPKKIRINDGKLTLKGSILKSANMMKESLEIARLLEDIPYARERRFSFNGFETIMLQEEIDFLDYYLWCEGKK